MRVRVLVQRGQSSEGLGADVAMILGLTGVHGDVSRQGVGSGERSATILTNVRFLAAVSPQMQLQVCALGKSAAARVTHVRFDASVRAHMRHQRTALGKTLAALLTEESLLCVLHSFVPLHMVRQRLSLRKRLRTERTFMRPVVSVL